MEDVERRSDNIILAKLWKKNKAFSIKKLLFLGSLSNMAARKTKKI